MKIIFYKEETTGGQEIIYYSNGERTGDVGIIKRYNINWFGCVRIG
ncbi:MAG: hypothetical protein BWY21_02198 [Parcubacteria group bacterium ADurb.Bin216]|nr:MAG: hypothetical protein BWY21_02198 [Parcubacteria group bacterium ADurb.Bin216]